MTEKSHICFFSIETQDSCEDFLGVLSASWKASKTEHFLTNKWIQLLRGPGLWRSLFSHYLGEMRLCAPIIQVEIGSDCAITNSNGGHFCATIIQINLHFRYSLSPLHGGWCWSHHQPNQQLDSGCLGKRWMEKMDNLKVSGSEESWHYPWGQQSHRRPIAAPRKYQKKDKIFEFGLSYRNGDLSQVPSASCSKTRLCCGYTDFATGVLVAGQGVLACFVLKKELIPQITPDFLSMAVVLHC